MLSHLPHLKEMPRDFLEAAYEQQIGLNDCLRLGYIKLHYDGSGYTTVIMNEFEYLKYQNKACAKLRENKKLEL